MTTPTDVLCAGIIVADHVCSPIAHLPEAGELVLADKLLLTIGGCAANVAVDLAKLGAAAAVVGLVGADVFGGIVAEMLRRRAWTWRRVGTARGHDTSQTLIVNVAGQDRRFIHSFGANAVFTASNIPPRPCKVLYLGGYLLMGEVHPEALRNVFAAARRGGAKTVLDVVTPGPADYLSRLEPLLPEVDVFLPNNHEAELITGEYDPMTQAERFHALGAKTAIVTLGDRGSVLATKGRRLRAGAFPMPFVDGSGGGDAFAAGYIDGLLRGLDAAGLSAPGQRGRRQLRARHRHDDQRVHAGGVRCVLAGE